MPVYENQSKFQNTAYLLIEIQTRIYCYPLARPKKDIKTWFFFIEKVELQLTQNEYRIVMSSNARY